MSPVLNCISNVRFTHKFLKLFGNCHAGHAEHSLCHNWGMGSQVSTRPWMSRSPLNFTLSPATSLSLNLPSHHSPNTPGPPFPHSLFMLWPPSPNKHSSYCMCMTFIFHQITHLWSSINVYLGMNRFLQWDCLTCKAHLHCKASSYTWSHDLFISNYSYL